ncbi:MAG TPA: hypothetical protein VG368_04920, partial [Acidimicrobiales bacterium]|nr:hypothetical protein [Acidimicrobiales bacterium]
VRMEIAADADSALRALRTAGYPATLMAQLVSSTGAPTFEDAFTIVPMPRPLPTTAGSLVAVVGPGSAAIDAAREIARDVHLEADEIALASRKRRRAVRSDLTVRNPRSAGDLAPGWRRGRVGVVAVACDGLADLSWVRSILSSVRPSYVLLVGRADAKSSDLSAIAERIGGVDALVLEGLSETLTPLAALDTGIPIARLDNTTANPSAWTDVLERAAELGEGTG